MVLVYIISVLVLLYIFMEFILYLAAFGGHTNADFTKHNFALKKELRPYADLILAGKRYCVETPHEDVVIKSRDGVKLFGRFYDQANRRGIVLMMHGYRSMSENDFSCSSEFVHNQGFAMLLVDQRAHGRSGGLTMTFGVRERWDVLDWVNYLEKRFPGEKIVVEGLSMGAATVVMAAGEGYPASVRGMIADCGYTSPKEIISHVIRGYHLPVKVFYPLVRLAGRVFGMFDCEECSACEAAKRASVPALFIHGEADDFVPCAMGRANFEAYAGPKKLVTVPGAEHGLSYVVDMPGCQQALREFLNENL